VNTNGRLNGRVALVLAAFALAIALSGVTGALAGQLLIGSKQIRNGSVLTQDIHQNTLKSGDIRNSTIDGADIGAGEVGSTDLTLPPSEQLVEQSASAAPVGPAAFSQVDVIGTYAKEDPTSTLAVEWNGTAAAPDPASCIFQLRVDGQPSTGTGGEVFVGIQQALSVSTAALFAGLPAGTHTIEVWAQAGEQHMGEGPFTCTVGPPATGVTQTFPVAELVE
jgi:hypothetical protein